MNYSAMSPATALIQQSQQQTMINRFLFLQQQAAAKLLKRATSTK